MRSVQSYKHYIYARCCPTGQVGRWNLIVARGMLKPVYFAFETILEFIANYTFVKSRAHSARPTSKIIAIMIALTRAVLMKVDTVVSLHAHCLFSGRACSCKKRPLLLVAILTTCLFRQNKFNIYFNFHSDSDECLNNSHNCSENANCTNTGGSFNCSCKPGYIGNGHNCSGWFLKFLSRFPLVLTLVVLYN